MNRIKEYVEIKDFCRIGLPSEENMILKFTQCQKSSKTPFIIYSDLEFFTKKTRASKYNPERSSTTQVGEHIPCGYSISTLWAFNVIENKNDDN